MWTTEITKKKQQQIAASVANGIFFCKTLSWFVTQCRFSLLGGCPQSSHCFHIIGQIHLLSHCVGKASHFFNWVLRLFWFGMMKGKCKHTLSRCYVNYTSLTKLKLFGSFKAYSKGLIVSKNGTLFWKMSHCWDIQVFA